MTAATTAADRAHAAIREAIIDGTYAPGEMLSENELAQTLGMSRTPVRAALARLQDDGWIVVYPKRGALVCTLDTTAISEIADARLVLEAAGVQSASVTQRRQLAQQLEPLLDAQALALANGDVGAFVTATVDFHRAFVEVGRNSYLLAVCERISHRQRQLLFQRGDELQRRAAQIVGEHRELLRLLAQEDPAGFVTALRDHLTSTLGAELALA